VRRHDYAPFGEEITDAEGQIQYGDRKLFTGHERDTETTLDYFGARYYRSDIGRFTTVDPELNVNAALLDPQRWNRYGYARNNPLRYTDPDGRAIVCATASCQEYAQRMSDLRKEFSEASGLAKVWAGVKLALAAGEFMPTPFAIAAEGEAAAIVANGARGRAFEASVIDALGATKNTSEFVEGMTRGGMGRSLPDLMGGVITEIKDVKDITFVKQLQVQYDAATKAGVSWNLIISPNTQTISQSVVSRVARTGGTITVWDSVAQLFRPWAQ
jgi:RHS repeat-associated protein